MLLAMDAQVQLPSRVISSMICMYVYVHAFMYVSIYYACIYVSVVLHMYLYARIHCIQVYVFMYVCMCLVRIDIECLVLGPSRLGQRLLALRWEQISDWCAIQSICMSVCVCMYVYVWCNQWSRVLGLTELSVSSLLLQLNITELKVAQISGYIPLTHIHTYLQISV